MTALPPRRPEFLDAFPDSPDLGEVVRAFEAGDYARVRATAPALATASADPEVRAAAADLLRRIEPDPLAVRLVLFTGALLAFLALYAYLGSHS